MALGAGGAALDQIPPASSCPATDQRGVNRPQNSLCDIGSYEKVAPAITTQASAGGPVGTAVTDTATVTGFNPTGTVTFKLFSDTNCATQVGATSTKTLAGPSATSDPITPASPGTYYWTAVYSGDNANVGVTSPCQAPNESVVLTKASPTIATVASAGGPVGSTPVRDVATLGGGYNPTGTVVFKLFSNNTCGTQVFTSTNNLSGVSATSAPDSPR